MAYSPVFNGDVCDPPAGKEDITEDEVTHV